MCALNRSLRESLFASCKSCCDVNEVHYFDFGATSYFKSIQVCKLSMQRNPRSSDFYLGGIAITLWRVNATKLILLLMDVPHTRLLYLYCTPHTQKMTQGDDCQ